ncbi:SDR family oxidoreductase [Xylophilus rhododendri]|uniref:SDR family oxidoreductase n=1 Tax=Xylophilus rhododendri TaxID=2697032 RepID=A0A857J7E6_9BURK|nr:SDR family oxidoreductase [Xylophilus rhododendri]QHI98715.1 SDR family oxidoreductase [Xylophilus rhododendri]
MNTASSSPTPLAGKVAFVTGGSRGIGAAIVRRLSREGAQVAFTYARSADTAQALVAEIAAAGGKALALQNDGADAVALQAAVDEAARLLGRIDILVNSAGVLRMGPLEGFSLADLDETLAVNVRAVFVATQAAARHMPDGGRVVTIGSINAERMPQAGGSVYAMSKAAIVGLTRGLARDLGPRGITVNNVQPGPTGTDMNPADGPYAGGMHGLMAIPRHAHADEVAGMVAYLVGPEAGMVTGASLSIDGGYGA